MCHRYSFELENKFCSESVKAFVDWWIIKIVFGCYFQEVCARTPSRAHSKNSVDFFIFHKDELFHENFVKYLKKIKHNILEPKKSEFEGSAIANLRMSVNAVAESRGEKRHLPPLCISSGTKVSIYLLGFSATSAVKIFLVSFGVGNIRSHNTQNTNLTSKCYTKQFSMIWLCTYKRFFSIRVCLFTVFTIWFCLACQNIRQRYGYFISNFFFLHCLLLFLGTQ